MLSGVAGWPAFAAARDRSIRRLRGRVLEIGAGSGANFTPLDPGVEWVGLEPSARLRARLAETARRHGYPTPPLAATGEDIPLPDASVDAVLATTVLCSVRDPARVLREAARVLVPGGRLVLAEHVAAPEGTGVRRLQQIARPWTRLLDHGCDPTRDTEGAVRCSPLHVESVELFHIQVIARFQVPFLLIDATKPIRTRPHSKGGLP
ncbi:class I SAM-dependent methyltransferase [Pseudactinotalea sp.]|uniref:class I SAM-dependent methyltransferase n=1 Tax=Pseudactinotalea sp. TaxID=1926260 RepID=UPI003B3B4791